MDTATGWCRGCYRTMEEIMAWGQGSEAFKQSVWQQLSQRQRTQPFPEAQRNSHLPSGEEAA